jgi:hypothetical protein
MLDGALGKDPGGDFVWVGEGAGLTAFLQFKDRNDKSATGKEKFRAREPVGAFARGRRWDSIPKTSLHLAGSGYDRLKDILVTVNELTPVRCCRGYAYAGI